MLLLGPPSFWSMTTAIPHHVVLRILHGLVWHWCKLIHWVVLSSIPLVLNWHSLRAIFSKIWAHGAVSLHRLPAVGLLFLRLTERVGYLKVGVVGLQVLVWRFFWASILSSFHVFEGLPYLFFSEILALFSKIVFLSQVLFNFIGSILCHIRGQTIAYCTLL